MEEALSRHLQLCGMTMTDFHQLPKPERCSMVTALLPGLPFTHNQLQSPYQQASPPHRDSYSPVVADRGYGSIPTQIYNINRPFGQPPPVPYHPAPFQVGQSRGLSISRGGGINDELSALSEPVLSWTPPMLPDELTHAQAYEGIRRSATFRLMIPDIKTTKFRRTKLKWGKVAVVADWTELLNTEELMWIARANAMVPSSQQFQGVATERYLFETILSKLTLTELEQFMKGPGASMKPDTHRKAFYSYTSSINKVAGPSLSKLSTTELTDLAREARARTRDFAKRWRDDAKMGQNKTEIERMRTDDVTMPANARLTCLYYVCFMGYHFFKAHIHRANKSPKLLKLLTGYTALGYQLARPASRPEVARTLTSLAQVQEERAARQEASRERDFTLHHHKHKTARSFGALITRYHPFGAEALELYIDNVVPGLHDAQLWTGPEDNLFPKTSNDMMGSFLNLVHLKQITYSAIRGLFSASIARIPASHPKFGRVKRDLESCASHQTMSTNTVEAHYQIPAKGLRENLMLNYLTQEFIEPALTMLNHDVECLARGDEVPRRSWEHEVDTLTRTRTQTFLHATQPGLLPSGAPNPMIMQGRSPYHPSVRPRRLDVRHVVMTPPEGTPRQGIADGSPAPRQYVPKRKPQAQARPVPVRDTKRDCTLCTEPLEPEHTVFLPCFHTFHEQCVDEWFDEHMACPTCQVDVNDVSLSVSAAEQESLLSSGTTDSVRSNPDTPTTLSASTPSRIKTRGRHTESRVRPQHHATAAMALRGIKQEVDGAYLPMPSDSDLEGETDEDPAMDQYDPALLPITSPLGNPQPSQPPKSTDVTVIEILSSDSEQTDTPVADLELTDEFTEHLRVQCHVQFRTNFRFGDFGLRCAVRAAAALTWPTAFDKDGFLTSSTYSVLEEKAKRYAKSKVMKNLVYIMPIKHFTKLLSYAPRTVAMVKTVASREAITLQLKKHVCFKHHAPSEFILSQVQKIIEQALVSRDAQIALEEKVGKTPDSKGHWHSMMKWRRGGRFALTRFEQVDIQEGDDATALSQDYPLQLSAQARKRRNTTQPEQVAKRAKLDLTVIQEVLSAFPAGAEHKEIKHSPSARLDLHREQMGERVPQGSSDSATPGPQLSTEAAPSKDTTGA